MKKEEEEEEEKKKKKKKKKCHHVREVRVRFSYKTVQTQLTFLFAKEYTKFCHSFFHESPFHNIGWIREHCGDLLLNDLLQCCQLYLIAVRCHHSL